MPDSSGGPAKYVYGVVRKGGASAPSETGINDEPIALVSADGLAALTSDVPGEYLEAGRDELLTHSRVLERTLEGGGTVLPMRFGVVMPDEKAVRDELLLPHREELAAQLDEMDGKVEMNIKGIYDEAAILREAVAESPEMSQLREAIRGKPEEATYYERIRLGELVSQALEMKRAEDERAIVDPMLAQAVAVEVGQPVHERMAVNASFLVERDRLQDFDRAIEGIGEQQAGRIRLRLTGPLPPHSFVELGVEA
jgi:hypothetical protein